MFEVSPYHLLAAFILDIILGDPHNFPHPIKLIGALIESMRKYFLLPDINNKILLIKKGFFIVLFTICITFASVSILLWIAKELHPWLYNIILVYLAYSLIAIKSLHIEAIKPVACLKNGDIKGARKWLSMVVGRDTETLDPTAIKRAVIETIAENLSDGIVAPLFYLVIGGVPLAMVYKAINTLDSMIGYKHGQYLWFGRIAAKTDDIANFIPARITALLIFVLSPLVRQNPVNTMKSISLYAKKHPSPNAGWPESAMAGALNISLGGPSNYNNMLHKKEWIGDGSHDPSYNDIKNSVKMLYSVSIAIFFTAIIISAIL